MKLSVLIVFVALNATQILAQDCTPLRCTLPLKPGNCTDEISQYYFDNTAKVCKEFTYTGCNGNLNRFRTLDLCKATCLKPCSTTTSTTVAPVSLPPRCTLKLDPGTCTMSIARYYYDSASGTCKTFNYSGCGGNVNNFSTKTLCEDTCVNV